MITSQTLHQLPVGDVDTRPPSEWGLQVVDIALWLLIPVAVVTVLAIYISKRNKMMHDIAGGEERRAAGGEDMGPIPSGAPEGEATGDEATEASADVPPTVVLRHPHDLRERKTLGNLFAENIPDVSGMLPVSSMYSGDMDTVIVVAMVNDEMIGGLVGGSAAVAYRDHGYRPPRAAMKTRIILQMAVIPEFRREGVGQKLVNEAEQAFRKAGAEFSVLEVDNASPQETHDFWISVGYTRSTEIQSGQALTGLPPELKAFEGIFPVRSGTYYVRRL